MNPTILGAFLAVTLFFGILVLVEVGRRIGVRRGNVDPENEGHEISVVEGAVFGLMGLLIAFTFSNAAARFDDRRQLIVEEANDIGTAWLRVDLLPANEQPVVRDLFRRYLDSRLAMYRKIPDIDAVKAELAESVKLQQQIWTNAVRACEAKRDPATTSLVLASLNDMIDITTTRNEKTFMHPPLVIFALLAGITLCGSMLVGYSMTGSQKHSWTHIIVFAAIFALTIYVIIEIEYPRYGLIRLTDSDQILVNLRQSLN